MWHICGVRVGAWVARAALLLVLVSVPSRVEAQEGGLSASEIVAQAEQRQFGSSHRMDVTMEVIRPAWSRSMSMTRWGKGTDFALMVITKPAKDRGTASLKRGRELWNWLPSIERAIKVTPSMLGQSWMGSDFSNDDILRESTLTNDYLHRLSGRDVLADGTEVFRIELTPKPDAPVTWGKVILSVSTEGLHMRRTEYYDEHGRLASTMTSSALKTFGSRLIPTRMEMVPSDRQGYRTVLTISRAEFDLPLDDSVFSLQALKTTR